MEHYVKPILKIKKKICVHQSALQFYNAKQMVKSGFKQPSVSKFD